MKLNPAKCHVGVSAGKFLGYMVTIRGIEASPEQINAILELQSPKSVKDIHKLTGRFQWTPEHEEAFQDLKLYLSSPPLLAKPEKEEPLSVYLSITETAADALASLGSNFTPAISDKIPIIHTHEPAINKPEQGMDIVGKLPVAPGQKVFMLAMTDYFSKWIAADSFRQVTEKEVISLIRTNIICRHGVYSEIVCDNGTQFVGKRIKTFYDEWNINLVTSTPGYPKANGQAESSNQVVINCLKKKLKSKRGKWA
ncbi:uncharacterized protein LOC141620524 [Silene latifolia]|uniref:uncharacterized protein LOC141620524 n=1 Tax=Silene latifolia TaxID=37657 RepID=UPI003D780C37